MAMLTANRKVLAEEDSLGQSVNFFGGNVDRQGIIMGLLVKFAWLRIMTQLTQLKGV